MQHHKDPAAGVHKDAGGAAAADQREPASSHAPAPSVALNVAPLQPKSIYDLYGARQRAITLSVVSTSQFLNPFSSSIMLPGLKDLEAYFHASSLAGAAVLAVYYFPLGLSSLAWGPACDLWGRKATYLASTALFALATLGCVFARSMEMLLGFRALQGVALGAYRGAGIGTIADIYPPAMRGLAIGILLLSTLVGPVLGPLLGGFLAQAYGWQAPFVALLVFAGGIILPATLLLVSETHQYKTLVRLGPEAAAGIREAPAILARPPRCASPWAPIAAVLDRRVVLHLLQATVGFAALITAQTELPGQLVAPPYRLSPAMIGVAFIATGAAGMIASPLGGKIFDRAAAGAPLPMLRLSANNMASLIGMPTGLLLYGWAAHFRGPLTLLLVGLFIVGFSMCIYFPAFMGYLSIVKQKEAGSASSGQNALMFFTTGVLVLTGSAITHALGLGLFMTLLAVLHVACGLAATWQIAATRARYRQMQQAVPAAPAGAGGGPGGPDGPSSSSSLEQQQT